MQFVIARKMNASRPYRIDAKGFSTEVATVRGSESRSRTHDAYSWRCPNESVAIAYCPRLVPFRKLEWHITVDDELALVGTFKKQTWREFFAFQYLQIEWHGAFHATQRMHWTQCGGSAHDMSGRRLLAWRRGRNIRAVFRGRTSKDFLLGTAMVISQISSELESSGA